MSAPIYFLPRVTRQHVADFWPDVSRDHGLQEVLSDVTPGEDAPVAELARKPGPGGEHGCLITALPAKSRKPPRLWGYYPDRQEWTRVRENLWVGVDPADRPGPEDLSRARQFGGYQLELADGHRWRVPTIRDPEGGSSLPRDLFWAEGAFVERIKDAYGRYWEDSAEVCGWVYDGQPLRKQDLPRAMELAIAAVGLNYRYDARLHNVLRLIDSTNVLSVLGLSVDTPTYLHVIAARAEAQKKTKESSSTESPAGSSPGSPADGPPIAQAAGSCT